ncbi:MAG: hypothetical protein ACE5IM_13410, partial [Nitrospinota bacterium]
KATATHAALQVLFVALLLVSILWHLATRRDAPGKRQSLAMLLRGRFHGLFVWGVILLGTVAPLILSAIAVPSGAAREGLMAAGGVLLLIQGFLLRLVTLRVGIHPPAR